MIGFKTVKPKYTDAEAVAAVEAEGDLQLTSLQVNDDEAVISGASFARIVLIEEDAAADEKRIDFVNSGGNVRLVFRNDAGAVTDIPIDIGRTTSVVTFDNIPVLPASDPTTDNQATRKAYVDQRDAKAYCTVGSAGTLQANSFNIDFTQKDATGEYTVAFDTNFGNTNYTCIIIAQSTNATINGTVNTPAVDRIEMKFVTGSGTAVDVEFHLVAFGDSV